MLVGVVSWWWIYCLPVITKHFYSCVCASWQPHPYFLLNICEFIYMNVLFMECEGALQECYWLGIVSTAFYRILFIHRFPQRIG